MCVYMHVCQEENKCCMVLDEGGKDSALILEKKNKKQKKVSSQSFIALEKCRLMGPYPAEGMERCIQQ